MSITVTAIHLYPVKSTAPVSVDQASMDRQGIAGDRRWLVADPDGNCITARDAPALLKVQGRFESHSLTLSSPGETDLDLPLQPSEGSRLHVDVWGDKVDALTPSPEADRWISAVIGREARLVFMDERCTRQTDVESGGNVGVVSFADCYPVLLASEESLAGLNSRMDRPIPMARFRPNIVVQGASAYAEDGWRQLKIGAVTFTGVQQCVRCVLTTVDPSTGERDPAQEPLRTLSTYRRAPEGGVNFGQLLSPQNTGQIRVGDLVKVI